MKAVTMSHFMSWTSHKDWRKITPYNKSFGCLAPVFQCDRFVQICLLFVPPSLWSRNDIKLLKPWNMSLIWWNLHSTWAKRTTFLWQTFTVSCSKRNIFIGPVDTVVWELSPLKNKHGRLNANGSIKVCTFFCLSLFVNFVHCFCFPLSNFILM